MEKPAQLNGGSRSGESGVIKCSPNWEDFQGGRQLGKGEGMEEETQTQTQRSKKPIHL